jgi:hypothetical protein
MSHYSYNLHQKEVGGGLAALYFEGLTSLFLCLSLALLIFIKNTIISLSPHLYCLSLTTWKCIEAKNMAKGFSRKKRFLFRGTIKVLEVVLKYASLMGWYWGKKGSYLLSGW